MALNATLKIRSLLDGLAQRARLAPGASRLRRRRLMLFGIIVMMLWALFGGKQGLVALLGSANEKASLRREIVALEARERTLEGDLRRLQAQPQLVEKTAREKLMLMRPGELIYRFDD